MNAPHWPRPHWQDSGQDAFLLWFVFGDFPAEFQIDAQRWRTRGTPEGIDVMRYGNRALAQWDGYPLAGALGAMLWEEDTALFERAKKAGDCILIRGSFRDPSDLDAVRDLVGTIAGLTELGGVAVIDPQTLSMYSAIDFRRRFFDDDAFRPRDHVLILCNDDEENEAGDRLHVHTRGLRKFARPDLSIRNVPADHADAAGALAERLVAFQCAGGCIEDGRAIEVMGLADHLIAREGGDVTDPAFNNRHLALRWPDADGANRPR